MIAALCLGLSLSSTAVPAVVERYIEAFEAGDVAAMVSTLGRTFKYQDYPATTRYNGPEAFAAGLTRYVGSLAKRDTAVDVSLACAMFEARGGGDELYFLCEHKAVYTGPTNRRTERYWAIYDILDNRIARIERLGEAPTRLVGRRQGDGE